MKYTEIKVGRYYKAKDSFKYYWIIHVSEVERQNIKTHSSLCENRDFYPAACPNWANGKKYKFTEATAEEIEWLQQCVEANKFVEYKKEQ